MTLPRRPAPPASPARRRLARTLLLGAALALVPATLAATARAQALQVLPAGLAASAAAIERAALEAFAGPDRVGKDGPLAPLGLDLARIYAASRVAGGVDALQAAASVDGAPQIRGDRVLIDATAVGTGAELLRDLEALGLRRGVAFGRVVSGELPIDALPSAAALASLQGATPARAMRSVGAVTSQGDAALRADVARVAFGIDGAGVAVGTLSDSYDCSPTATTSAAQDVASGDLPAGVVVLRELGDCAGAIDEGRAMMQIVHDVAPGASQLFHTAFEGQASFAQGILALAAAGADVIVDDVFYFAEPFFQDGIIAQAADQVVAAGVPFFSSAGNAADASYESAYRPTPPNALLAGYASVHDFDPGPGVDVVQTIVVNPGARITIILQWDDPFASAGVGNPGARGDVDLFLTNVTGTSLTASSVVDNLVGGDPVEIIQVTNTGGSPATVGVMIGLFAGVQPGTIKYNFLGRMSVEEYATGSPTSFGHANAARAMAVGAACYCDTPTFGQVPPLREPFTSLGGVPILFDVEGNRLAAPILRPKPEITAPDGADTTFFLGGDFDATGFPNFFGTSAAAPHAAAVAALLLQFAPSSTPAQVYGALEGTALDMDAPGFDFWTGHGLIRADAALLSLTGTVGFSSATYQASEGDGSATITVARTGGSAGAISVDYATADGSATAGSDYVAVAGTLTWSDGDTSPKSIVVPLLDDADLEGDEDLALVLASPVATTIDRADATLTIADEEAWTLAVTKGPASPSGPLASAPGGRVVVLQLVVSAPSGVATSTIDALAATIATQGTAGAPTDVAAVRLYLDGDGDGAIDAGSTPIAVAAPDADGDLQLAPGGLSVAAGASRTLLVELVFDAGLARLPSGAPLAALALPLLVGLAGVRRRSLVGVALAALLVLASCANPPARSAEVTFEVVGLDASAGATGVTITPSGLPIAGRTVTVTE